MLNRAEFRGALLALGGLLVLVYLVIAVKPGLPGELLLQSLRFHFVAAGLALASLIALTGARWRGLVLLMVALAAAVHGAGYVIEFQERRVDHTDAPLAQFRFLSFNVLTGNNRPEALVDAVLANPPDVMLVMETPGIESQLERLASVMPYRVGCDGPGYRCDISLLSRLPLENAEVVQMPLIRRDRIVTAEISVEGQQVTLVGVHLSKPYHDNVTPAEIERISRILGSIEGPLVLAGDFNAASWSEPLVDLGRLHDLVPGPWQPATWPVRLGPLGVPIDNVFTRGTAQLISLEAGDSLGSNHRPLWASVGLYPTD